MVSGTYPSWLEEVQAHDKASRLKEVISSQARWFYHVKEVQNFSRLNRELQLIEPRMYSNVALIGFARGTAGLKFVLPYWDLFFVVIRDELMRRGEDVGKVLTGI